jgi:hypothetical protein
MHERSQAGTARRWEGCGMSTAIERSTAKGLGGACGARTRSGGTCGKTRGWGTDHPGWGNCRYHGGSTPDGIKGAAREQANAEAGGLAVGRKVEPIDALLHVVYSVAGRVEWLGRQVMALDADGMLVDSPRGRELAPYAHLHGLELDRLARVSKMALDAGVAERRVRMAERTAAIITAAAEDAFAELGEVATPEVRARFALAFAARLEVLEATADEDEPAAALPRGV